MPTSTATPEASQRFPKQLRLRSPREFQRVYALRNSVADAWLVLYAAPNDLGLTRIGLSVSRKVGGAVVRNRWKRLLREAFRLSRQRLSLGFDLVVIPRAPAPPTLAELQSSLVKLSQRAQTKLARKQA